MPSKYFLLEPKVFCLRIFKMEPVHFVSLSNFNLDRTFFRFRRFFIKLLCFVSLSIIFGTNLSVVQYGCRCLYRWPWTQTCSCTSACTYCTWTWIMKLYTVISEYVLNYTCTCSCRYIYMNITWTWTQYEYEYGT